MPTTTQTSAPCCLPGHPSRCHSSTTTCCLPPTHPFAPALRAQPPAGAHPLPAAGVRGGQAAGGRLRAAHQVLGVPGRAGGLPPRLAAHPGHEVRHPGGCARWAPAGLHSGGVPACACLTSPRALATAARLTQSLPRPPPAPLPSQAAATPRTPQSPNTPLTPKLTGSSTHGPQFFDNATAPPGANYGLELFLASEASAVVEHTKQ